MTAPNRALISGRWRTSREAGTLSGMARLKLTLVLDSGARVGPGKAALLESVRATGSIAAAARAMGMDYKRAWLLVDSLNQAFQTPVVERVTGGPRGGGASLTPFGEELLARYRRLETAATERAAEDLDALERRAAPDPGPKV
jgi:molybdate transport system regulatory protein